MADHTVKSIWITFSSMRWANDGSHATCRTDSKRILEQNGLRRIRFHDLRHTCASLLLANNVPMKKIQEWLGHSDFSTTANIYAHLDFQSKISSAEAMLTGLDMS